MGLILSFTANSPIEVVLTIGSEISASLDLSRGEDTLENMRDRKGSNDSDRGIGPLVDQTLQFLGGEVDVDIHISLMFVPQNGSPDGVSKIESLRRGSQS